MPTTYNDPIMLDSTGQDIVDKLDSIATLMGDGVIDDTSTTATDKTWSAQKINGVKTTADGAVQWADAEKSVKKNYADSKAVSKSASNVTFTVNADKSISLSGTANANTGIEINTYTGAELKAIGSSLIISGGISNNAFVILRLADWTNIVQSRSATEEQTIDTSTLTDGTTYYLSCAINNGENVSGKTFYPMLRKAGTPSGYVAPIPDNTELMTWEANGVLGAKNLLPNEIVHLGTAGAGLGTKTLNTADNAIAFVAELNNNTNYIISTEGGNRCRVGLTNTKPAHNTSVDVIYDNAENRICSFNSGNYKYIYILTDYNGTGTVDTIKPMLRLATDTDSTYAPYAMTNRELTEFIPSLENMLYGEITDNEPYVYRQGKGNMVDLDLIGGSITWNQQVQNGNFLNTSDWNTNDSRATFSVANNVGSLINYTAVNPFISQNHSLIVGHKYLFDITAKANANNLLYANLSFRNEWDVVAEKEKYLTNAYTHLNGILNVSSTANKILFIFGTVSGASYDSNTRADFKNAQVFDLTQMFGSTVADAIYAMEQETEGAGIAFFRKYFPNDYYAYDTGSLQSVNVKSRKVVGKNNFDINKVWSSAPSPATITYNIIGNSITMNASGSRPKVVYSNQPNLFKKARDYSLPIVLSGEITEISNITYLFFGMLIKNTVTGSLRYPLTSDKTLGRKVVTTTLSPDEIIQEIDINLNDQNTSVSNLSLTMKNIQLEIGEAVTDYEPYQEIIYEFDNSKQLRGIPSIVNNKLVYDGDIYNADGSITRKYGIINLGDLNWNYYTDASIPIFYATINGGKVDLNHANILCAKYIKASDICINASDFANYGYGYYAQNSAEICQVLISDSAYTDAATFKTAMNGVYLVYELATPTTELAEPFQNPQRAFSDGTEEFIDAGALAGTKDVSIPVGNNSTYQLNIALPPIEDYVDEIAESKVDWASYAVLGAKNLLPPTITQTINNVVFTVNSNGTITVNNKPTSGNADLNIEFIPPKDGQYIVNGALSSNLRVHAFDRTTNDRPYADSTKTTLNRNNAESPTDEVSYYMLASHSYYITVRVDANYTASGEIFKPMVRVATDTDPTYAPYAMTNKELTDKQAVLGAYNILTSDYRDTFPSTKNGVDMTENADGTLVLDGTSTGAGEVTLKGRVPSGIHMYIPKGHWVYSVGSNLVKVYVGTTYNGAYSSISAQADGTVGFDITDNTNSDYKLTDGSVLCSIYFSFANGATFNNVKLYPMISPNGGVWVPPAMTNRELTEKVTPVSGSVSAVEGMETAFSNKSLELIRQTNNIVNVRFAFTAGAAISAWTYFAELSGVSDASPQVRFVLNGDDGNVYPVEIVNKKIRTRNKAIPQASEVLSACVTYAV